MNYRVFVVLSIFLCLVSGFYAFAQETATSETPAVQAPQLPSAIQDMLNKEMEKLPPVERHFRMAQDLHARGKLDEAIAELQLALKEDPKHVPSNCELGIVYMGKSDYDKAIEQLKKTLELDPTYPKTHYALANAYARKPNPDVVLARKHLDESMKLGYHAVPWFLDYMNKLEQQIAAGSSDLPVVQDKVVTETQAVQQ